MTRSRCLLTAEVEQQILGFIGAGGFPHVAAEAAGVPRQVFADWLDRGGRPRAREPYRSFARGVRQTAARARLKAEFEARQKDPRFWLGHGPGRETADAPGWTGQVKPLGSADAVVGASPALAEISQVWRQVLQSLDAFPEARAAVADALSHLGR